MSRFDDAVYLIEQLEEKNRAGGMQMIRSDNDPNYTHYGHILEFAKPDGWTADRFNRAYGALQWGFFVGAYNHGLGMLMQCLFRQECRTAESRYPQNIYGQTIACRVVLEKDFNAAFCARGIRELESCVQSVIDEAIKSKKRKTVHMQGPQEPFLRTALAALSHETNMWRFMGHQTTEGFLPVPMEVNVLQMKKELRDVVRARAPR